MATYPAVIDEVVDVLKKHDVGFLQLQCPELTYAGARRSRRSRAEYDRPRYRRLCRRIALSAVRQIEEFVKGGVETLAFLGVKNSPSCDASNSGEATGILVEEVKLALLEKRIRITVHAIDVCNVAADVEWLEEMLRQS